MNDITTLIVFSVVMVAMVSVALFGFLPTRRDLRTLRLKQAELDELRRQLEPLPPPMNDLSERIRK